MNKEMHAEQLEQKLTGLLGKKSYTHYKHACTGKYRGYYDYGLVFEDGTKYGISMGRKYYLKELIEAVERYQYFHDNLEYLTHRTKEIIERDNRQAQALGLSPIEFVKLNMETKKDARNLFWTGFSYKQNGCLNWYTETTFFYACRGVGLNKEKSVDAYFNEMVNRPDGKLGLLDELGKRQFHRILLGYLHI